MENQFSHSTLNQTGWGFSLIFHGAVFALVVFLTSTVKPIQPSEPFRWEVSLVTPPPTPVEQVREMPKTSPRPVPPKQARPQVMHAESQVTATRNVQSHHTHVIPVAEASPSLKHSVQSSTTPMTKSAASYTPAPAITAPPPLEQTVIVTGQASISPSSIVTNNPVAIPVALHHQAPVQSKPFRATPTSTAAPFTNEGQRTTVVHRDPVHTETTETAMRTVEERTIAVMPSTFSEPRTVQQESTSIQQLVASAPKTISTHGVERTAVKRPRLTRNIAAQPSEALIHRDAPEKNDPAANGFSPEVLAFLNLLRQRIDQAREYPYAAKRMGFEGTPTVKFALLPNGDLQSLTVSQSSGYPMLDEAAMEAIQKILPFKPPAEAIPLSIEIPIKFVLN